MTLRMCTTLVAVLSILQLAPAMAAIPYAGADDDRRAKQAIPPSGKALVYVFRKSDSGSRASPLLLFNGRGVGRLEAQNYFMWTVDPGRVDLQMDDPARRKLSLRCQDGRIYFVQLTVDRDGTGELQQVSYGKGRQDVHRARLVRETGPETSASESSSDGQSGFTLLFKGGSYQLGSGSQNILGATRSFTTGGTAFGAEGEWHFANGVAVGAEIFSHSHEYTTTASTATGELSVLHVMFNIKKYFRPESIVQPYIGAGLGAVTASFSGSTAGSITGSATGFGFQGMAGVAFRWRHVGLYTEIKAQSATIEDSGGQSVDTSGTGLFAGVSVQF
jgi:hypothetical protein